MKKKLLMYFLMLMLAFSFTACSGDDDDSSSKRSERDKDDEDEDDDDAEDEDKDKDKDKDKDDEEEKSDNEDEKSDDADKPAKAEDKDDKKNKEKPTLSFEIPEMSENLFDFQYSIGDTVYKLPMKYSDFEALDWKYEDDADKMLYSGDSDYSIFERDNSEIWVDVTNFSINANAVENCYVTRVTLENDYIDEEIILPKNIQVGVSTKEEIIEAYGEPADTYDSDYYSYLYYYLDEYNRYDEQVQFAILNEFGTLAYVELTNESLVDNVDNTLNFETPSCISDYVAPTELGDDIFDNEFILSGNYYELPCPVVVFLNNGYEIPEYYYEYVDYIVSGGTYSIDLIRVREHDGKKIEERVSVGLTNLSYFATTIDNCYVTTISYNSDWYNEENCLDITFSGGINIGSTEDELLAVLDSDDYSRFDQSLCISYWVHDNSQWEYNNARSYDIKDGKVYCLSITCDKSPIEE